MLAYPRFRREGCRYVTKDQNGYEDSRIQGLQFMRKDDKDFIMQQVLSAEQLSCFFVL